MSSYIPPIPEDIPTGSYFPLILASFTLHLAIFYLTPVSRCRTKRTKQQDASSSSSSPSTSTSPPDSTTKCVNGVTPSSSSSSDELLEEMKLRNAMGSTFHALICSIYVPIWMYCTGWSMKDWFDIKRTAMGGMRGTGDEWIWPLNCFTGRIQIITDQQHTLRSYNTSVSFINIPSISSLSSPSCSSSQPFFFTSH